ncbi:hypothetical protein U1Q18_035130 [Sarracenia purpurea var. burkii]
MEEMNSICTWLTKTTVELVQPTWRTIQAKKQSNRQRRACSTNVEKYPGQKNRAISRQKTEQYPGQKTYVEPEQTLGPLFWNIQRKQRNPTSVAAARGKNGVRSPIGS